MQLLFYSSFSGRGLAPDEVTWEFVDVIHARFLGFNLEEKVFGGGDMDTNVNSHSDKTT